MTGLVCDVLQMCLHNASHSGCGSGCGRGCVCMNTESPQHMAVAHLYLFLPIQANHGRPSSPEYIHIMTVSLHALINPCHDMNVCMLITLRFHISYSYVHDYIHLTLFHVYMSSDLS